MTRTPRPSTIRATEPAGRTALSAASLRSDDAREAAAVATATGRSGSGPGAVITVSGLTKRYGEVEAVRGIDFEVTRGETFGFLGPNGAGKTTTLRILSSVARVAAGTARRAARR